MGRIIAKKLRGMNWMAKISLILIFTVIFCIIALSGYGARDAAADTHYSRANTAWATVTTWSTVACGGVAAAAAPAAGDDVVICTGNTVTLGAAPAIVLNLTIETGATLAGATYLQTLTGNYTNSGTHSGTAGVTLSGAAKTIDGTGSVTNTGTFTISGTKTIASTADLTFAGVVTCSAAVTNNGIVTITNTGAGSLAGASSWTQGASSTLNYAGSTITITTFTPTGAGNTVNYSAAGAQTVRDVAYVNLTTSGSGTKTWTLAAARVVGGIITVGSGTNLTTAGNVTLGVTGATNVTGTLTLGGTSGKTFTGDVTLNSGSVWNETAISTYAIAGNFTNNATTFTASTGVHTFSGATKTISGTTAISIPSATFTGTYTNNGTLTVGTALAGAGGLTQGTNAVLTIGGTSTVTTLTATASGNTVNYSGAAQTGKVITYYNLTLSGSGIKTFGTTPTVNGILSIEGTATVVVTTGVVTYGANATLQYKTTDVRTVTLEEWLATTAATGGVIIANTAGSITMNAAKVFNNSIPLTINSGATLATGNWALTLGGNFVNNGGTFTVGTSTVLFNGTGNQSISGSNTWYSLSITAAAARTVKFASGATQTIAAGGSLNLQGFSATQPLSLAPTVVGTAWLLNKPLAITPTISKVSVYYSDASSGGLIDASDGTNSNAGNNTNWKFSATSASCVGCHGYKATFGDGTARNTPAGTFQGSHNEHVATYSNVCSVCHVVPATETSADFGHRNSTVQIVSPINGLAGSTYSKASFTQANSFTPGTCSNTYCHSNGTSVITLSIPANTSTTWGGTATCTSCHGVGGGDDGRPNYANNSPKRNTHGDGASYGVTHKATACPICHTGISGTAGAYTVDPATHNDGAYNLQVSMGYTQFTGNCATAGGCHGSVNWGGSLPCLDCHDAITDNSDGEPTRRAMSTEVTTFTWSHKRTAGAWTSYDCGVCHMEGDPATGNTTAFHKNNLLEFRDPDTGTTIKGVTFSGTPGSYTSTAVDATAATFARDTGTNTLEPFAQAVQVNLCLKCHDSDASAGAGNGGAKSSSAWVPGGSALRPFATAPTHTPGNNVLDVYAHFTTTNASYHPIRGKQNNSYANNNTINAPWNFTKVPPSNAIYGYLMTCWDCHDSSAAPRTIGGAVASVTAHGNAVTLRATYDATADLATALCVVCHKTSVYWTTTTHTANLGYSALNANAAGEWTAGGRHDITNGFYGCTQCHGTTTWAGVLPARPNRAINAHGFNTIADGVTTTWPVSGKPPYSFMRCTNNMATWNNTGGICNNGTDMCGRSNDGIYTPGGTY